METCDNNRFVVIGSNSFSGAAFVSHLLTNHVSVVGMSRSVEPALCFLPYRQSAMNRQGEFRFLQLDLNHDLPKMMAFINEFKPAYIVNFASQSMVAESWQNPDHWFMTNVVSTIRLHEKLRVLPYLKKYVHVSTPEVYGNCSGLVTEDAVFNPTTPYAVSRAACDMSLKSYFKNYGFPVVFTRAANVFGPGQQLYRIVPKTIMSIKMGHRLPLHGGGHSVRSFIHIDDVAKGTYAVALNGKNGEAYHFSTPVQISIRKLVEMICAKMNVRFEDCVDIVDERPGKDAAYLLDSAKAERDLGWKAEISLETGIDETIQWVEKNFEDLKKQPLSYIHKP